MREIKFRAWHMTKKGGHLYEVELLKKGRIVEHYCDDQDWVYRDKDILMQYTGLKDKNGTEIYEGDIVTDDDWIIEVKLGWQNVDAFNVWGYNFTGEFMRDKDYDDYGNRENDFIYSCNVIGNIYENPELLKASI